MLWQLFCIQAFDPLLEEVFLSVLDLNDISITIYSFKATSSIWEKVLKLEASLVNNFNLRCSSRETVSDHTI